MSAPACRCLPVILLALLSLGPSLPLKAAPPAQSDRRCFPETNQCISGRFREYWEQNGGLGVFGYPLSPAMNERTPEGTFLVQHFERNRFELHPEKAPPYDVLLGRLGDVLLRRQGLDWQLFRRGTEEGQCLWFAATRHSICDMEPGLGFRSFWEGHGLQDPALDRFQRSLALFGLPISEAAIETNAAGDTVVTQWFERARFEWHPDKPREFRVLLGLLGREVRATSQNVGNLPANSLWILTSDRISALAPGMPSLWLPKGGTASLPTASPDGARVIYTQQIARAAYGDRLVAIDARTAQHEVLRESSDSIVMPQFSPDGRVLAITIVGEERWQLELLDLATRSSRVFRSGNRTEGVLVPVAWTSSGLLIHRVRWQTDAPPSQLALLDVTSGASRTIEPGAYWSIEASADGRRVAIVVGALAPLETPDLSLIVVDVMTRRRTTIASRITQFVSQIAWSPDGSRLLYVTSDAEGERSELNVVQADGSSRRSMVFGRTQDAGTLRDAAWRTTTQLALLVAARDDRLHLYDLPADTLRTAGLQERGTLPGEGQHDAMAGILYVPRSR